MGKLVVTEFVSIDGIFEDPGGAEGYEHGGWTFEYSRGDDGDKFKLDELTEAGAQLLGRVTYEAFAEAWPSREGPFADKLNNDPKYVVSATLENPTWQNTTVISADVPEEIAKLKAATDGTVLVAGSGTLVATLLANDLVPRRHRSPQVPARRSQDRRLRWCANPDLRAGMMRRESGRAIDVD